MCTKNRPQCFWSLTPSDVVGAVVEASMVAASAGLQNMSGRSWYHPVVRENIGESRAATDIVSGCAAGKLAVLSTQARFYDVVCSACRSCLREGGRSEDGEGDDDCLHGDEFSVCKTPKDAESGRVQVPRWRVASEC